MSCIPFQILNSKFYILNSPYSLNQKYFLLLRRKRAHDGEEENSTEKKTQETEEKLYKTSI